MTRCSPLSLDPALVRLVHAACRTSALNQNHVALAYPSAILPAHDCGIARSHARYAAVPSTQLSGSSKWGTGCVDVSLSEVSHLSHAKHSPILREWSESSDKDTATSHRSGTGIPIRSPGKGLMSGWWIVLQSTPNHIINLLMATSRVPVQLLRKKERQAGRLPFCTLAFFAAG